MYNETEMRTPFHITKQMQRAKHTRFQGLLEQLLHGLDIVLLWAEEDDERGARDTEHNAQLSKYVEALVQHDCQDYGCEDHRERAQWCHNSCGSEYVGCKVHRLRTHHCTHRHIQV